MGLSFQQHPDDLDRTGGRRGIDDRGPLGIDRNPPPIDGNVHAVAAKRRKHVMARPSVECGCDHEHLFELVVDALHQHPAVGKRLGVGTKGGDGLYELYGVRRASRLDGGVDRPAFLETPELPETEVHKGNNGGQGNSDAGDPERGLQEGVTAHRPEARCGGCRPNPNPNPASPARIAAGRSAFLRQPSTATPSKRRLTLSATLVGAGLVANIPASTRCRLRILEAVLDISFHGGAGYALVLVARG